MPFHLVAIWNWYTYEITQIQTILTVFLIDNLIWIPFHPHSLTHTRGTNQKPSFLIGGVYDSNSLQNLNVKQYTYVFQKSWNPNKLTVRRIIKVKLSSILSKSFGLCVPIVTVAASSREIFLRLILTDTMKNKLKMHNDQNRGV